MKVSGLQPRRAQRSREVQEPAGYDVPEGTEAGRAEGGDSKEIGQLGRPAVWAGSRGEVGSPGEVGRRRGKGRAVQLGKGYCVRSLRAWGPGPRAPGGVQHRSGVLLTEWRHLCITISVHPPLSLLPGLISA